VLPILLTAVNVESLWFLIEYVRLVALTTKKRYYLQRNSSIVMKIPGYPGIFCVVEKVLPLHKNGPLRSLLAAIR
jgi:hypothetical protein